MMHARVEVGKTARPKAHHLAGVELVSHSSLGDRRLNRKVNPAFAESSVYDRIAFA
jgi:hypothetical protein